MDLFDDISKPTKDEQMEPGLLLEESWFFGNLLDKKVDKKSRMLRCYSDPCPSFKDQDFMAGKSMEETFSSLQKLPDGRRVNLESRRRNNPRLQRASKSSNLQRAPSLPVFVDYKDEEMNDEESEFSMGKLIRQASINHVKVSPQKSTTTQILPPKATQTQTNLQRVPSLPAFVDKEEIHDEENEFSMGKLIRQASLNHARILPPKCTSKGLTRSPSISSPMKHQSRRKQEQESNNNMEGIEETRRRNMTNKSKITRSSSTGFAIGDLQGFKNLDLNNEKKNKKKPIGLSDFHTIKNPYVSETWLAPAPDLVVKKSSEDMKEHIKFWARAVASNVR